MVQIRCCDILMKSRRRVIQALIASAVAMRIITVMPLEAHSQYTSQSPLIQNKKVSINGTGIGGVGTTFNKVVLLSFDDNLKGDFVYAKPILDKYGFKATFFIICNKTGISGTARFLNRTNWQDIAAMQKDVMDIQSHTMNHRHLNHLSANALDSELGGSKQCLANHGYHATTFAYPYNEGSSNATVVNAVAKYYSMARSGTEPLMFLHCNGYKKQPQKDCRTYLPDGKLTYANRYAVRSLSFDVDEIKNSFNNAAIFADFIKVVNSQNKYNSGGIINAIPLITFHDVDLATNQPYITNVDLFDQLMKYLHDNGFKVLTMANLGYNRASNTLYVQ
ncbi:MAG TPA: polysaccharide deacetylase family protein [Candidatus Nitrosopolaris rasttigaisensis]|nr:polysaccharide deacetylase family protein [Candidatus Nitrosopolaris rasttigaisensis]